MNEELIQAVAEVSVDVVRANCKRIGARFTFDRCHDYLRRRRGFRGDLLQAIEGRVEEVIAGIKPARPDIVRVQFDLGRWSVAFFAEERFRYREFYDSQEDALARAFSLVDNKECRFVANDGEITFW